MSKKIYNLKKKLLMNPFGKYKKFVNDTNEINDT